MPRVAQTRAPSQKQFGSLTQFAVIDDHVSSSKKRGLGVWFPSLGGRPSQISSDQPSHLDKESISKCSAHTRAQEDRKVGVGPPIGAEGAGGSKNPRVPMGWVARQGGRGLEQGLSQDRVPGGAVACRAVCV